VVGETAASPAPEALEREMVLFGGAKNESRKEPVACAGEAPGVALPEELLLTADKDKEAEEAEEAETDESDCIAATTWAAALSMPSEIFHSSTYPASSPDQNEFQSVEANKAVTG